MFSLSLQVCFCCWHESLLSQGLFECEDSNYTDSGDYMAADSKGTFTLFIPNPEKLDGNTGGNSIPSVRMCLPVNWAEVCGHCPPGEAEAEADGSSPTTRHRRKATEKTKSINGLESQ